MRVVIVGGGLAGATAAATLREQGFGGDIEIVGNELVPPYNRPPLSKGYLRGQEEFAAQLVHPTSFYLEHDITLRLGVAATAVDVAARRLDLADQRHLSYDALLVTTGGRNRVIDVPGASLDGIFQLRTVKDCDRIQRAASPGGRAVVVGLGFIGSEVTASLTQMGVHVSAIEGNPVPLARVLGPEIGGVLADIHRDKGVELLLGDGVAAFEGVDRVERVRTKSGRVIPCDLVVVGIGIQPNVELLAAAGASIDNGVLVDARCRTSLPDVYAAGDVANHPHPIFGRLRVEHWNNASQQGAAAARSLLGDDRPYEPIHSFWSDQYEHLIEYVGFAARWDRLVIRGALDSRRFLAFYLVGGVIRAAMGLDRGGDPEDPKSDGELKAVVGLIRDRVPVDPARLADDGIDLDHARR